MKDSKRVTVIIPNYNGEMLLPTCLDSLSRQSYRDFSVIVVDNGSADGSARLIEQRYPFVALLRLPDNLGFAAAVNAGIRNAESEFVALLNNDTEAHPEWLKELVEALDRRPDISFCASKMVDFKKRNLIDSAGNCYALNGRSIPRGFLEEDSGQYDREEEVFGACAGAALYRRTIFHEVGLFDEKFVSYKEDVDIDFRFQLKGFRCLYVPGAVCYHVGGATLGRRKSDMAVALSMRNSITTFLKDMPSPFLPRAIPLMLFDIIFQIGYQAIRGSQLIPLIRGIAGAIAHLPHALARRRQIQRSSSFDRKYMERLFANGAAEVKSYRARCRAAAAGHGACRIP